MIYYASSHTEGARGIALKCGLRPVPPKEFISERKLGAYVIFEDHDVLLYAVQEHKTICAYALSDLILYFHPDTIVPLIKQAYKKYFDGII